MPALARLLVAATAVLALTAGSASAEERMWIGFHDDPVLRYGPDRLAEMDAVRGANATIVRTLVEWRSVAPKRPASAANAFDPSYRFADLDEFVRNAQQRGMEVLMTIWGTPKWANGGKGPAYLPTKMADFQNFARAVATRYNGRRAGYPFVRFYGIWNESNLGNFLAPQFNSKGKIVSPAAYAKLAAAGYAGIKAGSPKALVAIGETSSNGKDKPKKGSTDSTTPGTFAKLVAQANKKLKFDAWAQHPYPVPVNQGPAQKVRYPNVAFSTMKQFEKDLDKWFGRKNIPIWITEYGNETKPGEPKGVTEAQQAAYVPQAIAFAKKDPRIPMFVWFVFRDSAGESVAERRLPQDGRGQAGRSEVGGRREGCREILNGKVSVKGGTANPLVNVNYRDMCTNNVPGTTVGVTWRAVPGNSNIPAALGQTSTQCLAFDCTISVRLTGLVVAKGRTYRADIAANTATTPAKLRTITIVGT